MGRNRKNAMTICVHGSSSRGNAVLRMSLPPPATEPAACDTPLEKNVYAKMPGEQVRDVVRRPALAAAEDVDEEEVDRGVEQRVQHQPELAEGRLVVLRLELGAGQLTDEGPPLPELAEVPPERRQTGPVRPVDVVLAQVLVLGGRHGRGHVHLLIFRTASVAAGRTVAPPVNHNPVTTAPAPAWTGPGRR